jgi:hypothetical protein
LVEGVLRVRRDTSRQSAVSAKHVEVLVTDLRSPIRRALGGRRLHGLGGHVRRVVVVRPLPIGQRDTDPRLARLPAALPVGRRRPPRQVRTAGARRIARGTRGAVGRARAGRGRVAPAREGTRARGAVHRRDHAVWLSSLLGGPVASSGPVVHASRSVVAGPACVSALLTSALLPTGAAEGLCMLARPPHHLSTVIAAAARPHRSARGRTRR